MLRIIVGIGSVLFCLSGLVVVAAEPAPGISPAELFPGARFDSSVPTQVAVLGFAPGARPMRHDELMRYLEALVASSPRARMTTYSTTHEGRPMVYLAIGERETIAALDEFREEHRRRLDPRGRPESEDAALVAEAKAVAWMAYGIHGDELSSVDAAAALAYWLVAGEDDRARRLRRDLVVLIDPCENPDGRDRYLAQTRSFAHAVPSPDSEDLSHTTVWPWGRGNHYLFDLNRDWFSMVQPESRRSSVIATWDPQLMVDSHEMGAHSTYLFSPPRHPFNPHLPASHLDWWNRFAADQAQALDAHGFPYFTGEWNEEFFPGYGSSWASYRGALGILYEMSRTSGTVVRKRGGTLRDYAQATLHQVTSSVANLESLASHRSEFLADFIADRRHAIELGKNGPVGAWLLPEGRHPERTRRLVELLRAQGIEVLRSEAPRARGLRDIRTGDAVDSDDLPAVCWLVPIDQAAGPLVRELLDPHVPMNAEFFREEREYLERGRGTRLYEVTAWSLPLAYGIDAYWTADRPGNGWSDQPVVPITGKLEGIDDAFGYLIDGTSDVAAPTLVELLQRGLHVRVAGRPFRVGDHDYGHGTLLVRREGNPSDLEQQLVDVAAHHAVTIRAVPTSKAEQGPDLGGSHFHGLTAPRVGIWTGAPISPSAYGALWHVMDQDLEMRFSALDLSRFDSKDLERYNVLVFPPSIGGVREYRSRLGEKGIAKLRTWLESGGTAIGIGSGAEFLADADVDLTRARLRRQALDRYPPVVFGIDARQAQAAGPFRATGARVPPEDGVLTRGGSPYDVAPVLGAGARPFAAGHDQGKPVQGPPVNLADWLHPYLPPGKEKPDEEDLERADERLRRFAPRGAFVRIELDHDVWLTWGLDDELSALARASDTLVAEPPVQVAARFAELDRLQLGGLLWPEAAGRLARTAYATRESTGRGQVILFLNEPEFRGWTLGTRRLLINALLLGPGLGTQWSNPW